MVSFDPSDCYNWLADRLWLVGWVRPKGEMKFNGWCMWSAWRGSGVVWNGMERDQYNTGLIEIGGRVHKVFTLSLLFVLFFACSSPCKLCVSVGLIELMNGPRNEWWSRRMCRRRGTAMKRGPSFKRRRDLWTETVNCRAEHIYGMTAAMLNCWCWLGCFILAYGKWSENN